MNRTYTIHISLTLYIDQEQELYYAYVINRNTTLDIYHEQELY